MTEITVNLTEDQAWLLIHAAYRGADAYEQMLDEGYGLTVGETVNIREDAPENVRAAAFDLMVQLRGQVKQR